MPDPHVHTAAQRPATGLDAGARTLILRIVGELSGMEAQHVVGALFRDRFGGFSDYVEGVERVWGRSTSYNVERAMSQAAADAEFPSALTRRSDPDGAAAGALLLTAPEPDFRTAVTEALRAAHRSEDAAARITQVCRSRGVPWAFSEEVGFEYVGDEQVERDLIRPALEAVGRAEFRGGVRSEFEAARGELATGTPTSLKQAVHEAGCAVESAMKVLLDKRGVSYDERDTASTLFNHLVDEGIVPRSMEKVVLVAMTPRNKKGGHGAGASPHAVAPHEAEAIVAGAGGAIAYLAAELP